MHYLFIFSMDVNVEQHEQYVTVFFVFADCPMKVERIVKTVDITVSPKGLNTLFHTYDCKPVNFHKMQIMHLYFS